MGFGDRAQTAWRRIFAEHGSAPAIHLQVDQPRGKGAASEPFLIGAGGVYHLAPMRGVHTGNQARVRVKFHRRTW
jgi:hypothetical protein